MANKRNLKMMAKKKPELKITPEELMAELARSLKTYALSAWEIYLLRERGLSVEARDQKLEAFELEDNLAVALRVLKYSKLGFGFSTDLRLEPVGRLVKEIFERMSESDADPDLGFPRDGEPAPALPEIYDPSFRKRSEKEKIARAMLIEKSAREADRRIKRVRECAYHEGSNEIWISNSFGLSRSGVYTHYSASASAVAEQGDEAQIAGEFDWSFRYDMLSPEKVGRSAGEKAAAKLGGKPIPSVKAPVILIPEIAGGFLSVLSHAFSGENLAKNKTWLKGMEGRKIFSEAVTVIDDGLFAKGPECFPFDGEGAIAKRKILLERGVMKDFIFDSYYGSRMKRGSSGNARREGVAQPPAVGPSNFYLCAGSKSPEQMLAGIGSGFRVEEVLGMHTADAISGEFSVGVSGHWIRRGQLEEPVSRVAVAGTLQDLFSRVLEVGNDLRFYGGCASPSLLIEEMEISGS